MSGTTSEIPVRAGVPVAETWDLATIFPTVDDWEHGLENGRALLDTAAAHRGHLATSPARLRQALDDLSAANVAIEHVIVYAFLQRDEDTADGDRNARYERAMNLAVEAGEKLAFVKPELLALDEATYAALVGSPEVATYHHMLEEMGRHRPHTRSIEIEELLAQNYEVARISRDAFGSLDNADLDFGTVTGEDGEEIALTKGRVQLLLDSKNRDVRRNAYTAMANAYLGHKQTIATLHAGSVRTDAFYARARNFPSARASALFDDAIPESVYDSLIEAVRDSTPAISRYLDLRRSMLGIDDLAMYDTYVPLAPQPERQYSIGEALEVVTAGMAPLGPTYATDFRRLVDARMIDWHETKGKRSGAYSAGAYGTRPVILMNWNGTTDHVFTLTHEAGHAMHTFYADANNPYHDAQYPIFTAEVASTVNEVLLTWHLLDQIGEDDLPERFAILNRFADTVSGTLLRQTMFAEFEHLTHQMAEAGVPLTFEALQELFGGLIDVYLPGVQNDDLARITWGRVPHFYRAFYVYQYATGIASAIALAGMIRDGGQPAAERYLDLLRAGGSDYPLELLKRAGVDLTTPDPVKAALVEFDRTVAEMQRIADSGALGA